MISLHCQEGQMALKEWMHENSFLSRGVFVRVIVISAMRSDDYLIKLTVLSDQPCFIILVLEDAVHICTE